MNQSTDNTNKQEYQAPVLFEYGDIASITQLGIGDVSDGTNLEPQSVV